MTGQVGRFRMRRVALAWLTCGMLGGLGALAALPASAAIRIGIIGDQTGAADLDKAYAVLQQGVDALKSQTLDIVLHVGGPGREHQPAW
jgi:hypothetical protein